MTQQLEETIKYLQSLTMLPDQLQDRMASHALRELERHRPSSYEVYRDTDGNFRWREIAANREVLADQKEEGRTDSYWLGGYRPSRDAMLAAGDGLKALAQRHRLGSGLSLRELIDDGRRH